MRGDPPGVSLFHEYLLLSTPHARGSTPGALNTFTHSLVYPACAGIHLRFSGKKSFPQCLPRMRGDPPGPGAALAVPRQSTPHARGSTPKGYQPDVSAVVYPACAGIHLPLQFSEAQCPRLPRMRGDPPSDKAFSANLAASTPHARGSTVHEGYGGMENLILHVVPVESHE